MVKTALFAAGKKSLVSLVDLVLLVDWTAVWAVAAGSATVVSVLFAVERATFARLVVVASVAASVVVLVVVWVDAVAVD